MTTTGKPCGRAQSSTACSGTTSSRSPWITSVPAGTVSAAKRLTAGPTSTTRSDATRCATRVWTKPPKGETREHQRRSGVALTQVLRHRKEVLGLAAAFVVLARACADAAEIRPRGEVSEVIERLGQRGDDFIVLGAALHRIGMSNQRDAAARASRIVQVGFDGAGGTFDQHALETRVRHRSDFDFRHCVTDLKALNATDAGARPRRAVRPPRTVRRREQQKATAPKERARSRRN